MVSVIKAYPQAHGAKKSIRRIPQLNRRPAYLPLGINPQPTIPLKHNKTAPRNEIKKQKRFIPTFRVHVSRFTFGSWK
jgi:hypothetical protein